MPNLSVPVLAAALVCAGCTGRGPVSTYATPTAATQTATATEVAVTDQPASVEAAPTLPAPTATEAATPRLGSREDAFAGGVGGLKRDKRQDIPGGESVSFFGRCADTQPEVHEFLMYADDGIVWSIERTHCSGRTNARRANAEARRFFPADAPPDGTPFRNEDGEEAESFVSPSLADRFDAEDFVDCEDNPVPAGTFSLLVLTESWTLETGTCPV